MLLESQKVMGKILHKLYDFQNDRNKNNHWAFIFVILTKLKSLILKYLEFKNAFYLFDKKLFYFLSFIKKIICLNKHENIVEMVQVIATI